MIKMTLKAAKGQFVDRKAVLDAVGKAGVRVGSKWGSLARGVMRRMMKKRKGPAPAGQPPHVHQGGIKDHTYYALDPKTKSVVCGPVQLGKGTAPKTLDAGGTVEDLGVYDRKGKWIPLRVMSRKGREAAIAAGRAVRRKFAVQPRPFTKPTLAIVAPKMAAMLKGQVKR